VLDGDGLLVVGEQVGRTPPIRRSATSTAASTDGWDLSSSGRTTRNLDQASHRQNKIVAVN
jgi:hypothetical protein